MRERGEVRRGAVRDRRGQSLASPSLGTRATLRVKRSGSSPAGIVSRRSPSAVLDQDAPANRRRDAGQDAGASRPVSAPSRSNVAVEPIRSRKATVPRHRSRDANVRRRAFGPRATCKTISLRARAEVEGAAEDRRRASRLDSGLFEHVRVADGVREDDLVAMAVLASVMGPRSGQRAVGPAVASLESRVVERAGLGVRPAGADGVGEFDEADDLGVDLVPAVEVDPVPVDEAVAAPRSRQAHRVVVEDRPVPAPRDAARPGVEADGDTLVGEVRPVVAHLVGGRECRAVVHRRPRLDVRWLGAASRPFRQAVEIGPVHEGELGRVVALEERFTDVMNDVVFLRGHHPGLRRHLAEAVGERAIEAVGVAAVLEPARGEPQAKSAASPACPSCRGS